ncbi:hypothetical protein TRFO_26633 [Tritrichomonas foetus]|uniref:F5/8 type C domain-containing protein n=1 Tax=Tritrichomonas foetus TaxID=1144522 RepID=A0A1J4K766_9EUKA|nr:hypothetical protein TRFO_26633 [Tritrichomonas foetus]|eukprot:OHT05566.1 hypothetical protein TRFO_26633 [Tritrichomonas foetus]
MTNSSINFQMNTLGIFNIPFDAYVKDFLFIINGKEYKTNRIVADLISPKICKLHQTDYTIDSFSIDFTIGENDDSFDFNKVLGLVDFKPQQIKMEEIPYFLAIFEAFDNEQAVDLLPHIYEELTPNNAVRHIHEKIQFFEEKKKAVNSKQNEKSNHYALYLKKEIEYIAFNFCDINADQLKNLDVDILELIISHNQLRLLNEEYLFTFVNEIYNLDRNMYKLFEYIDFSNLSSKYMNQFIENFYFDDMNGGIWHSICKRLSSDHILLDFSSNRYKIRQFLYDSEDNGHHGIIYGLTQEGWLEENVLVASSSASESSHSVNELLNEDINRYYQSQNEDNSWISFDFKERKVKLTHYKLRSGRKTGSGFGNNDKFGDKIKNWVLECSNDGKEWINLDTKTNYSSGWSMVSTNEVTCEDFYRFFRLRNTGLNSNNNYSLVISCIDFYGYILNPSS